MHFTRKINSYFLIKQLKKIIFILCNKTEKSITEKHLNITNDIFLSQFWKACLIGFLNSNFLKELLFFSGL